ncbi:hypothetical protein AB0D27_10540 [Streptomyces sp. NPDC048415]|uniref:hypothetical protein n=1 Tax=Streptomyces sp. NPDC048415 TaxID=3154822 RepID=UPI00341DAB4F
MGGAASHFGDIAEMQTGEGKTLVGTLPVYLKALTSKGFHLVTPMTTSRSGMPSEWGARTGGLHFTAPTLDTAEGVVEGAFAAPEAGARPGRSRAGRRRKR